MHTEIDMVKLGALVSIQGGFAFKSQDFSEIGVPILKIKNVKLRDVDTSDVDFVPSSAARGAVRYYVQHGDLLISMTGSGPQAPNSVVGRVARYTIELNRRMNATLEAMARALVQSWFVDFDPVHAKAEDLLDWQPHIRSKARREALGVRFRDPQNPFKLVIVRDMWLTGFDAPSLHTMYIDKPMQGHGLMQAIARVNRVFRDKPGGLVVDYLGLADQLRQAMITYTESNGAGQIAADQAEAVALMLAKYEVCCDLFHGFDWSPWMAGNPSERLSLLPAAQEHILSEQTDGPARLNQAVIELSKAFALAMPADEALAIRDDVAFFQAVRAALVKTTASGRSSIRDDLDHAVRQIVSQAIAPGEVIDIFEAAGLPKPNLSIISDEFLSDVRGLAQKNLAVEVLRKLLNDEIRSRQRVNLVQSRSFATMLEESIHRYHNRAIETVQVLEELIAIAKELRAADARGQETGLSSEELAFYEALEVNDSAVKAMGDETLKAIARELTETLRHNATIDWTVREGVRAKMRVLVKRILRRYGYPPDKQEKATQIVLEQAELLSETWAV